MLTPFAFGLYKAQSDFNFGVHRRPSSILSGELGPPPTRRHSTSLTFSTPQ